MRACWYVAFEMEGEGGLYVCYGKVLNLAEFKVTEVHKEKWRHWQNNYDVGVLDWALGLEVDQHEQLQKSCKTANAVGATTVEDVSILKILIGVVDHTVPSLAKLVEDARSISTVRRGRKKCYTFDDCLLSQHLPNPDVSSSDDINHNIPWRRGQQRF